MKVSEAKEKVCPFIQQLMVGTSLQMEFSDSANIHCITSDCMAWQSMKQKEKGTVGCESGHKEDGKYLEKTKHNSDYGYCKRLTNE